MPRLTRKNIKVFAGSATNNGVFGSLQANNPTTTSDVEQLQSLSAWSEGWNAATETSEELPPLEEIQGVEYVTTYQQAYIMQEGIPEWAATVTYYKGCLTKEVTSTGFKIYNSLTDNNTGNLLSDTSNWKKVMDSDDVYAFDNTVVHKTGNETISGVKTFSVSPIIPTATTGDSSTKAASTAFVTGAINTINNAVVHLAGAETITGVKTLKNTEATIANPPNNVSWRYTDYTDNNNVRIGVIGSQINSNGWHGTYLQAGNEGNIHIITNGTDVITYASPCDAIDSIVTTTGINKAQNGYVKLGNGIIIQWGTLSSGKTITYSTAFTNADSYALVFNNNSTTDGYGRGDKIESKSSTSATVNGLCENPIRWLAIGY